MKRLLRNQSFLGHAAIYGFGSLLTQAAAFVLLPLVTRTLDRSEFGLLEILNRIGDVATIFLLFGGIRQATLAMIRQSSTDAERHQVASTLVLLLAGITLVGGTIITVFADPLSRLAATGNAALLTLAVWAVLLDAAVFVVLGLAQARLESLFFVGVSFTQFLLRIGVTLLAVLVLQMGMKGVLLASVVTSGSFLLFLSVRELSQAGFRFHGARLLKMLGFAGPLLPCGLGFFLLNNGDRFFLLRYAGAAEVGEYALAYKLALAVVIFGRQPLSMVWSARIYDWAKSEDSPRLFGQAITRMLGVYVFVGLGVCVFQREAAVLLGGSKYASAGTLLGPLVLAYFFCAVADMLDASFYVRRRTSYKTGIALVSTAVMFILYLLWIPSYHGLGAAWATLVGYASHAALTRVVSQRIFAIEFEWVRVAGMLFLAAVLWGFSRTLPDDRWGIVARAGLWLAWPGLVWVMGLLTSDEKRWLQRRVVALGGV